MSDYLSDYTGPLGEHPPSGVWAGIAEADRHLAEDAARDQLIAELHRDLADVTAQNDRLQNENAEMLCRIDELTGEGKTMDVSVQSGTDDEDAIVVLGGHALTADEARGLAEKLTEASAACDRANGVVW